MSIAKKAIISTFLTSGLNYIAMAVGFIFGLLRDQILLPEENGIYMFGLAVVDMLFIFAAVSFNITVIQAKEEKEDLYSTAFVVFFKLLQRAPDILFFWWVLLTKQGSKLINSKRVTCGQHGGFDYVLKVS